GTASEDTAPGGTAADGTVVEGTAPEGTAPEGTAAEGRAAEAAAYVPELDLDADEAVYVLSILRLQPGQDRSMPRWQKALFRQLNRASAQRTQVLHLPTDRTVVLGAETEL